MEGFVSVFCAGGTARGVTLEGLKYPLDHAELTSDFPLGVSNEFVGLPARISVEEGSLLAVSYTHLLGRSPASRNPLLQGRGGRPAGTGSHSPCRPQ